MNQQPLAVSSKNRNQIETIENGEGDGERLTTTATPSKPAYTPPPPQTATPPPPSHTRRVRYSTYAETAVWLYIRFMLAAGCDAEISLALRGRWGNWIQHIWPVHSCITEHHLRYHWHHHVLMTHTAYSTTIKRPNNCVCMLYDLRLSGKVICVSVPFLCVYCAICQAEAISEYHKYNHFEKIILLFICM